MSDKKDYVQNVCDFVKRTLRNLEIYSEAVKNMSAEEKYEVTQIINSLLGLIVFPVENLSKEKSSQNQEVRVMRRRLSRFPNPTIENSYTNRKTTSKLKKEDFFAMCRSMRHAIAHRNIETVYPQDDTPGDISTIKSLRFTDKNMRSHTEVSFVLTINNIFNIIAHIAMSIDPNISQKRFEDIAENLSTKKVPIKLDLCCSIPAQDEH